MKLGGFPPDARSDVNGGGRAAMELTQRSIEKWRTVITVHLES